MPDLLTAAIKEAWASRPSVPVLNTLQFSHAMIGETISIVSNKEDIIAKLETGETVVFKASAFELTLPRKSEEGVQQIKITAINADKQIGLFLSRASGTTVPIICKYRPYLGNDLTQPAMGLPLILYISNAIATPYQVEATASFLNLVDKKFLKRTYCDTEFPGLGS